MPQPVLFFIRHGETDWNVAGRLQGQRDVTLNATGREQATASGAILRGLIDRDGRSPAHYDYWASSLMRARETMELVRETLGLEPHAYRVDDRLRELTFGAWEGKTLEQIGAMSPDLLAERQRDKWHFVPPGGESYAQLFERVRAWYGALAADTVVAAHGGTARALIALLGVALPQDAPNVAIEQGVVYGFAAGQMTCYR